MSKLVAVQGCTIKYEPSPAGTATIVATIVPPTSPTKSGGNRAHTDKITINVVSGTVVLATTPPSPITSSSGTVPPGVIVINASALTADSEGKKFVLKGDNGSAVFNCIFPASTTSGTAPYAVTIKGTVDDTGQNVLKVT